MEKVTDERLVTLEQYAHMASKPWLCVEVVNALRELRDLRARHREAVGLLTMSAEEMEESCAFEGQLTSMKVGAERIRAFLAKEQSDG